MKNLLEKVDSLIKGEQSQMIIAGVCIILAFVALAYLNRKWLMRVVQILMTPFLGSRKPYHPSFKDRGYDSIRTK